MSYLEEDPFDMLAGCVPFLVAIGLVLLCVMVVLLTLGI